MSAPINIYEMHLGSWKNRGEEQYFSYREIAEELSVYVKQMGYTHVENAGGLKDIAMPKVKG